MHDAGAPPKFQAVLPSRAEVEASARAHWDAGRHLAVFGEPGSGRTVFANRLLGSWPGRIHRLTGVPLLRDVQFSALAVLVTQVLGKMPDELSVSRLIAALSAEGVSGRRHTLVLDEAEFIDDSSAAVILQVVLAGGMQVVMLGSVPPKLPGPFRELALQSAQEQLGPLTSGDALVIVEEILGAPTTLHDADRLRGIAGRNARYLRELVIDARDSGGIHASHGFARLREDWVPKGRRTGELITIRLSQQSESLRRAVSLLAVTGEIPMTLAEKIFSPEVLEQGLEVGLLEATSTAVGFGEDKQRLVRFGGGLTSETVLAHVSPRDLRKYAEHALGFAAQMHPQSKITVGLHAVRTGVGLPQGERESLAEEGLRARLFDAVLVLTDPSDGLPLSDSLRLTRSKALFETRMIDPAFEMLGPLLEKGDFEARVWAATMSGALGRMTELEYFLTATDKDDEAQRAELMVHQDIQRFWAGGIVSEGVLLQYANAVGLPADIRADALQGALMVRVLTGEPRSVMVKISSMLMAPQRQTLLPSEQGNLLMVLFITALATAEVPAVFSSMDEADWEAMKASPALFLAAEGLMALEAGDAKGALGFMEQAVVVIGGDDRAGLTAYFASAAALAAAMIGDRVASAKYRSVAQAATGLGGPVRMESHRMLLFTSLLIEGPERATTTWQELRDSAERDGQKYVLMRLLHDGWRLGFQTDTAALRDAAREVDGGLAEALARYHDALAGDEAALGEALSMHLASGRPLFAAELAVAAARAAHENGRTRPTSPVVQQGADGLYGLCGVDTPILHRARVDRSVLSEREFEVCSMAASGASNAEIAAHLFLSPRTIEGHLQRAFSKLGIDTRQRLAPPTA